MEMNEEWLMPGAVVPVDAETTAALVAEIKRLIGVVGDMALNMQPAQHERVQPDSECKEDDGCPTEKAVLQRFWRKAQQQEPVATGKQFLQVKELLKDMLDTLPYNSPDYWISRIKKVMPLYTSPPASKPLTYEQREGITAMWSRGHRNYTVGDIIDAVEAAHGITGEQK